MTKTLNDEHSSFLLLNCFKSSSRILKFWSNFNIEVKINVPPSESNHLRICNMLLLLKTVGAWLKHKTWSTATVNLGSWHTGCNCRMQYKSNIFVLSSAKLSLTGYDFKSRFKHRPSGWTWKVTYLHNALCWYLTQPFNF